MIFRYIPLRSRLQRLFGNKRLAQLLRYTYERCWTPGVLEDVSDGSLHDKFLEDLGPATYKQNTLFSLSTDGINVTRKGSYSVWPISCTLLNLPPWLRSKAGFLLLSGIIPH